MSIDDRRSLPRGRNFDVAEGIAAQLELPIKDNAGADIELGKISAALWKAQPTVFDDTGAVEKTMGDGVTFALVGTAVYATIQLDAGDLLGITGSNKKVSWPHRLVVTYDSEPYLAMQGHMRVFKVG